LECPIVAHHCRITFLPSTHTTYCEEWCVYLLLYHYPSTSFGIMITSSVWTSTAVIQHTQNYNLPTGSMDTGVDTNSSVRISKVCTVTTKEEDTKRNQYSEHRNIWRKIQDNYHKKTKRSEKCNITTDNTIIYWSSILSDQTFIFNILILIS
jgi:hypothetical protein